MGVSKENMQNSGSLSNDKDKKREQVIKNITSSAHRRGAGAFVLYLFLLVCPFA